MTVRRWVLYAMVPGNVAVMLWTLMGRGLFGVELGWRFPFVLVFVLPVLAVCFTLSTVLAFRQKRRPVRLTTGQASSQMSCWLALVVFGAAVIDYVDADIGEARESVLTEAFGFSIYASYDVTYVAAGAAAASWVVLTVLLLRGRAAAR